MNGFPQIPKGQSYNNARWHGEIWTKAQNADSSTFEAFDVWYGTIINMDAVPYGQTNSIGLFILTLNHRYGVDTKRACLVLLRETTDTDNGYSQIKFIESGVAVDTWTGTENDFVLQNRSYSAVSTLYTGKPAGTYSHPPEAGYLIQSFNFIPGDRIMTVFSDPNYNLFVIHNTNIGSYQSTVSTGSTAAPGHGYGVEYGTLTSNATDGVGGQYRSSIDDSLLIDTVPWDTTKNRYVRQITLQSGWIRVICENVPGTTPVKYVFNSVAAVSTVNRDNSQFRSTHAIVKQF